MKIDQIINENAQMCPECGGPAFSDLVLAEKKDACYSKVRSRYKVWPSAYASGALVQCRKKGAANWGNKSKNESLTEFAPGGGDDDDYDSEDVLFRLAQMWYTAADEATEQRAEQTLAKMGWEIGGLESEEGGAFVMEIGDDEGHSYIAWSAEDLEQGVTEMDKSQPSHGRDGKISHSTYGSRDRGGSTGPERTAKATTADKMMKHAHDVMMKSMSDADKVKKGWRNPNIKEQGVAEGSGHDIIAFEIDSENAYNRVMQKFGNQIGWDGETMLINSRFWPAVQELAYEAGGEATEVGGEQDVAEGYYMGGLLPGKYYLHSIYMDSKIFTDPQSGKPMAFDSLDDAEDFRSNMSGREYDEYQVSVFNGGQLQPVTEGIEGEIAGGAIGGLVGGAAGSQLGPIGGALGSAVGGSVGSAIGSRYQDGKPLKEKQQLDEFAPLLAAGARLFMAAAPKIAQVLGRAGQAGARGAGQAARAGAEVAAKNAGQIGLGMGAYEIGSSVADIAKEITAKVGKAVDEKTVLELATMAFKYAIPAGIVLAILYGGKKAIDSLFSDREEKPNMSENKPKEKEADYGPDYQDMVSRLKQLAGQGPRKTVWDAKRRVYKTVPINAQHKDNK